MKRILLIILAMFALSSFYGKAQIADVRTLDYKSGNLYLDGNQQGEEGCGQRPVRQRYV